MEMWFQSIFFFILMSTSQAACASKTLNCVNPFLLGLLKHKLKSKVVVQKITTTLAPTGCICVPYYQCDGNNTIITDGLGLIDLRANYRPRRCTGDLEVCCKPPKPQPSPQPMATTTTTRSPVMETTPLIFSTTPSQAPATGSPTTMMIPGTKPTPMVTIPSQTSSPTNKPIISSTTLPTSSQTTIPPITLSTLPPITISTSPSTTKSTLSPLTIPESSLTTIPTTLPTTKSTTPSTTMSSKSPMTSPTSIKPSTTNLPLTTLKSSNESSEECICVPSYLCDEDGYIITNGEGVINPRLTSLPCPSANEVCCKKRNENNKLLLSSVVTNINSTISSSPMTPAATSAMTTPTTMSSRPITTSPTTLFTSTSTSSAMCICVSSSQCDSNGYIIVSGSGVIDPRFRQSRQATNNCVSPEICCKLPPNNEDYGVIFPDDGDLVSISPPAIDPRANLTSDIKNEGTTNACRCVKASLCTSGNEVELDAAEFIDSRFRLCLPLNEVCCKLQGIITMSTSTLSSIITNSSKVVNKEPIPSKSEPSCGIPGPPCKADQCPVEEGSAYFGEFPWMVALLSRQSSGQPLFLCGGSLINPRAVLSATHCVLNRQKGTIIARVGEYNTSANNESYPFQEAEVQAIVTHPQYYSSGLYNDIAVLILQTPVNYAVNVNPVCLPEKTTMFDAGARCLASGWGKDGFDGKYQKLLQKIDLPLLDRNECQNRLRETRLGKYFQLHSSFICAGGEESKDTCTGDGGGPLVCPTPTGQYIQVGIVSWGIGCGESNVPAVYVNVAPFRSWIDQQLTSYGLL